MRIVNFILSFYLIVISCLPCADMEVYSTAHSSQETALEEKSHSHDKENDLCPPFCACNCCGAQTLAFLPEIVFDLPLASTVINNEELYYKSICTSKFFGSIWQPPQIV
jgi:hypothetical protein